MAETVALPSCALRAAARFVTQGRDCQALGVPIFSRVAASEGSMTVSVVQVFFAHR